MFYEQKFAPVTEFTQKRVFQRAFFKNGFSQLGLEMTKLGKFLIRNGHNHGRVNVDFTEIMKITILVL